jgi:DNA invertase Pin-like site-specific DNA recombinase
MKVIYARISTANQNIERQMKKDGTKVFIDVCSGALPFAERPDGKKLMKAKDVTIIEVAAIDRLGRNLRDILSTLEYFTNKGVDIYIKSQGLHTMVAGKPNPTATMIIQIMASVAEFERKQIRERTAQGIAIAKTMKGKYKGRKRGAMQPTAKTIEKHAEKIQVIQSCINDGKSLLKISNEYNYSRGLIYRLIEKGFVTPKQKTK